MRFSIMMWTPRATCRASRTKSGRTPRQVLRPLRKRRIARADRDPVVPLLKQDPVSQIDPLKERRDLMVPVVPLPEELEREVDLGLGLDKDFGASNMSQSSRCYHRLTHVVNKISVFTSR